MGLLFSDKGTMNVKARQEDALYQRLGCDICPLRNVSPGRANATGSSRPDILIMGEAPGEKEQLKAEQFIGQSGQLIRPRIPKDWLPHIRWTNTVHCRPPKNRTPERSEVECCRPRWVKDIEETQPLAILGCGNVPLQAITGFTGITMWRGRRMPVKIGSHVCWYYPMLHPSYLLRQRRKEDRDRSGAYVGSEEERMFVFDLNRALQDVSDGLPKPVVHDEKRARAGVEIITTGGREGIAQIRAALEWAKQQPDIGADYETNGLRPYRTGAKILTAAVATMERAIAFPVRHREAEFTSREQETIDDLWCDFLENSGRKWVHNLAFEMEWTGHFYGPDLLRASRWEDSATQASVIDERKGKSKPGCFSLEFLVQQYYGFNLKKLSPLDKKNLDGEPLPKVLSYNAMDSKYHYGIGLKQEAEIKRQGMTSVYEDGLRRVPAVILSQLRGVPVNQKETTRLHKKYSARVTALEEQIQQVPVVQTFGKDKGEPYSPGSSTQTLEIFHKYLRSQKCVQIDKYTKKVKYSCNEEVLSEIDHPLSPLVVAWRKASRNKSTYLEALMPGTANSALWPDWLLHGIFNTYWAETGRLSCAAGWTPVTTKRGVVPLQDVVVGDQVWTHKGRWRRVLASWSKGIEQMLDVHLSNGSILTCTRKHRVLSSAAGWVFMGDIYGGFKEVDADSGEQRRCNTQEQGAQTASTGSRRVGDHHGECAVGVDQLLVPRRLQGVEVPQILTVEDGGQEPYDRQVFGGAPQLEGGARRWQWLPDNQNWKWPGVRSSRCFLQVAWVEEDSQGLGDTPYRRRSIQQQPGQPGFGYQEGAYGNTQTPTARFPGIEIAKIEVGGSYEVFDITVEEDASYETCGVFSHNSEEPNLQNFPKRDGEAVEVRQQVEAAPGECILSLDLGQIEARVIAMFTKDPVYVKSLWERYDIHMEWTERLARAYPDRIGGRKNLTDKDIMKTFRSDVKNQFTFPLFFGASLKSISGYLHIPEHILAPEYRRFWKQFETTAQWQERQLKFYRKYGYIDCLTGRRRHGPMSLNQVFNSPVQGTAAEMIMDRMCAMSETGDPELQPELQIHDDLTFLRVKESRADIVAEKILDIMLDMSRYDWINVPISVELSHGYNWAPYNKKTKTNPRGLSEIGTFWSDTWLGDK